MRIAMAGLCLVWAACCIGCGSGIEANAYVPSTKFVRSLERKAEKLAASELKRLSKAELTYKNEVRFDRHEEHPFNPTGGVYYKGYRQLTGAKVEDIQRTDSFRRPIAYVIAFDYRLQTTPLRHSDLPDSRELVLKDTTYTTYETGRYTLTYRADPDGGIADPLPGVPPYPNILLGKIRGPQAPGTSVPVAKQKGTDLESKQVVPKRRMP